MHDTKSAKPKVSVIIPTYNSARYLPDAIESIFSQTFQDFEIIVVDDGSIDNTKGILSDYLNKYPDKIKYLYKENGGCASARNYGLKKAKGMYINFLDSDDVFLPCKLEVQTKLLYEHPEVGFVYSNSIHFNEKDKREYLFEAVKPDKEVYLAEKLFTDLRLDIATALFRKECFEVAGNFDEEMRWNEDTEILLRIAINFKAYFFPEPTSKYRIHPDGKSRDWENLMKGVLYSSEKVLKSYPDFAAKLGSKGPKIIAGLKYQIAKTCIKKGKYNEARIYLESSLKIFPKNTCKIIYSLLCINSVLSLLCVFAIDYLANALTLLMRLKPKGG
jgi:glycosyltransferase involved in cell wall biosynthesis